MGLALLTTIFFFVMYSSVQADNVTCISNYADLKDALRDKETDNVRKLLDTFYPPNGSLVHFLNITYCLSDSKTECSPTSVNYTYHWADNGLLLVIEPKLLTSLTLGFIYLDVSEIVLIISPPFCSNESENNIVLLNTLTTWLKHYATSEDDETDRGYVAAYVPGKEFPSSTDSIIRIPIQLFIPFGLLTVVINVLIILSFRVCSRTMADRIDKAIERAISTITSGVSDEQEECKKKRPPFLETISSPGHNAVYILAAVCLTLYDLRLFEAMPKYNIVSWLVFFPVPIIAPLCLIISVITPICIKCIGYLRGATEYETKKDTVNHIMTIALLTVLSAFALFHGFWMAMVFAVYPSIALSKALILIPMCLPLLIIFRKIPYFVRKFSELCKRRGRKDHSNQDGKVTLAALCYVVFVIVVMWPAVLLLINYISNYFIIVSQLAEDLLQLIVIVAIVTLITYRLAKVFVDIDQENEDIDDDGNGERDNLLYGEVNYSYEPPTEEIRGLNYEDIKETTIQMEETTLHAGRENEVDAEDETMPIPYDDRENRTMPVPYVLVK